MARIEWSRDYELGIEVIDGQHRRIVDYINQLADAEERHDQEAMARIIHHLVDYTQSHFAFEEALLEEVDYATLVPHQRTHGRFIQRIEGLRDRFEAGEDVAAELGELLKTWLIGHIRSEDARYAPAVKERFLSRGAASQRSWIGRAIERFFGHARA